MAKSKTATIATAPSSNWKSLRAALNPAAAAMTAAASATSKDSHKRKRRHSSVASADESRPAEPSTSSSKGKAKAVEANGEHGEGRVKGKRVRANKQLVPVDEIMKGGTAPWQQETGQYLAMDCEMVGVGPEGIESTLARVSIVNYHGCTILDRFVRPREKVTDYRTWVSAPSFADVQKEVSALLDGRILVGHALSNDTTVLLLSHPRHMTRDTSKYSPLQGLARTKRPGLKTLAKLVLGVDIQSGEHSSIIDARATMAIYRSQKAAWEDALLKHSTPSLLTTTTVALQSLDLTNISLTGVGKKKLQSLGLAATLRHVRNERALGSGGLGLGGYGSDSDGEGDEEAEEKAEMVESEKRKKRRVEEGDDLVLGFDFEAQPKPTEQPAPAPANPHNDKKKQKKKQVQQKGKAKGGAGAAAFGGDASKRPAAKDGWWEDD
ncbi:3'-5' exonuclease [Rhodotorula mucilaginosa]|uniref:RNA exonuclease 4 n=1 Tax=Rhodotorula mucilaginosa TaxID=5537 RepID=A0A9P7B721_RHOMI|nr:3'-5' exonuclease [Rhodotorula mucilaginosa]TKA52670.1 hypothetical protein B0A53_04123 [Rhodotorula sp. CCFEE 5036]